MFGIDTTNTDPEVLNWLSTAPEHELGNIIKMGANQIDAETVKVLAQRGYTPGQLFNSYLSMYGARANNIPGAEIPSFSTFANQILKQVK